MGQILSRLRRSGAGEKSGLETPHGWLSLSALQSGYCRLARAHCSSSLRLTQAGAIAGRN